MERICRPAGIHDNDEVAMLSSSLFRLLDKLIDHAAGQRVWGLIPPAPPRNLAFRLRVPSAYILERGLEKLIGRGLVERRDDGALWVTLFDDPGAAPAAAPAAPSPAESRSTKWRRRQAGLPADANVPPRHFVPQAVSPGAPGRSRETLSETTNVVSRPAAVVPPGVSDGLPPHARVGDVNVRTSPDSEDCYAISSSSETLDPETLTSNVAPTAAETNPAETNPAETRPLETTPRETRPGAAPETSAPPRRTSLPFPKETTARNGDVNAVVGFTGDDKSRGRWVKLWKHCNSHGALHCWDEAFRILTIATKSERPPANRGGFLNVTLCNLLRDAGFPADQGTAAERDEARGALGDLRQQWDSQGDADGGDGPQGVPA